MRKAWLVWSGWRSDLDRPRTRPSDSAAIAGRLTAFGSIAFVGILVSSMGWTLFEDVALRSVSFRKQMASMEIPRRLEIAHQKEDYRSALGLSEIHQAAELVESGEYRFAQAHTLGGSRSWKCWRGRRKGRMFSCVSERWRSTIWPGCSRPARTSSLRDPERAEEYARKSLKLSDDPVTWNTLAVALFRKGDLRESALVFQRSRSRRQGGDPFDWLYLAMIYQDQGRHEDAKALYEQSLWWMGKHSPRTQELSRLRQEAADHLGIHDDETMAGGSGSYWRMIDASASGA